MFPLQLANVCSFVNDYVKLRPFADAHARADCDAHADAGAEC